MDKQIIIDGCDVNALCSDQIACMNRYEVARLFIKTVEQLQAKEQECEELRQVKKDLPDIQMPYIILYRQIKAQCYKLEQELEQYKRSKQASYEAIQTKCNELELKNRKLEAENEEFKNKLFKSLTDKREKEIIIDQLKAELNRANCQIADDEILQCDMREAIEELKGELEQEKALKETYLTCYKTKHGDIEGVLFKLKQTLSEIKEIAESCGWNFGSEIIYKRIEQILQKISEVDDESYLDNHWLFTESKKGEN